MKARTKISLIAIISGIVTLGMFVWLKTALGYHSFVFALLAFLVVFTLLEAASRRK